MASSVYFKFKSQKEPSRVEFDGTGISVFELKREIIIKSGLGDGTDFDLSIYAENGKDEYDDDTTIIPRTSTVIARRIPPMKPGAGRAARYMSGKMPINQKNSSRKEQGSNKMSTLKSMPVAALLQIHDGMTEEEQMAAMFEAQNAQWAAQQDEMAKQTAVHRGKKGGPPVNIPDRDPPLGYICYRCQEKGHWIQACPTNDDPNFDNKPRVKRTTGIPRSFLKTVEKPVAMVNDGTTDEIKLPSGVMVNAEGDFVIAEPDKASWDKFQAKTKSSAAAAKVAEAGNKELQEKGLECPIDKRLFVDPMKTPCCQKTYCNECIEEALISSEFICPGCNSENTYIDDLKPDVETRDNIKQYLDDKNAAKKEADAKERSKSPDVKRELTPTLAGNKVGTKSPSPKPGHKTNNASTASIKSKSPQSKKLFPNTAKATLADTSVPPTAPTGPNSKKRPAEELLENPKIPKGPKAMQQQQSQKMMLQEQQAMMAGMGGMPNFPGMPMGNTAWNAANFPNMMNTGGFMPMMGMGGMNPMMNFGGFPNMYGMNNGGINGMNGGGMGNMNLGGMNMDGGMGGVQNGFPNQQKTVFAEPLPNEEDNAYFRKPVNPHRHQGKQRRSRPSDYREL